MSDVRTISCIPIGLPTAEISPTSSPSSGITTVAGLIGEAMTFRAKNPIGTLSASVVSQPGGSSADFSGGVFTPTHAGDHVFSIANGTLAPVMVRLRVFPSAALTHRMIKEPNWHFLGQSMTSNTPDRTDRERRTVLWNAAREAYGAISSATMAALTTNAPIPSTGVDWPKGDDARNGRGIGLV